MSASTYKGRKKTRNAERQRREAEGWAYSPEIVACKTSAGEGEGRRKTETFEDLQLERVTDSVWGSINYYYSHECVPHLTLLSFPPSLLEYMSNNSIV